MKKGDNNGKMNQQVVGDLHQVFNKESTGSGTEKQGARNTRFLLLNNAGFQEICQESLWGTGKKDRGNLQTED